MITRLMPTPALVTVAAVAMCVATVGLPMPGGCDAVAGATPSPTCGGDLRECLRQSADTRQSTFGGRYVTAEDVSRCVDAFNSCIHGGASAGGADPNAPSSTPGPGGRRSGLPQHFGVRYRDIVGDCRTTGDQLTCTEKSEKPASGVEWTQTVTGTLSGLTMNGTATVRHNAQVSEDPGCFYNAEGSGTATYIFSTDGTVTIHLGPQQHEFTYDGTCPGARTYTYPAANETGTWSAIG